MALHELLAARRAEVLNRWEACVRNRLTLESMPEIELINHMPLFVDDLIRAIGHHNQRRSAADLPEASPHAAVHGRQRLRLGFDVEAVIREYGILHRCLLELLEELHAEVRIDEHRVISECIVTGIAEAVAEYVRGRDDEHRRATAQRFSFFAHDLRNTLSSASLAIPLLDAAGAAGKPFDVLERNIGRATELVEGALIALRSSSGHHARMGELVVADVVREALADCAPLAAHRDIEIATDVDPDLRMQADPTILQSTLTNLLHNAVKFSSPGATVELRVRATDSSVFFEVEDRCGGLPAGELAELTTPFAQLGTDRSGFGLGLSIVRHGVESHGGALDVRNKPGIGCVFTVRLPRNVAGSE